MKLIIHISETDWKFLRKAGLSFVPPSLKCECTEAVYNGIPCEEHKEYMMEGGDNNAGKEENNGSAEGSKENNAR